jgi:hypothetical protein
VINGFEELANYQWYGLDAFDFFSCPNEFMFEIGLFILNIAFLEIKYLKVMGEFLVFDVVVLLLQLISIAMGQLLFSMY